MQHAYYVRYGLMGRVGRFLAPSDAFERGQSVVVETRRGRELGEVLLPANPPSTQANVPTAMARVLRTTTEDDLACATRTRADRDRRFSLCQQVFQQGVWPFDLIDVEPLLDDGRTVVHYLGPHDLDVAGLLAVFRSVHDLDLVFEPVGRDTPDEATDSEPTAPGCGSCGAGAGGCGTGGSGGHSGCSDCALKKWTTRSVMVPH